MRLIVLGAAAGGGFPQWNSNAAGCRRARANDPAALPRSQASLAVSDDGTTWTLLNAAPDLREQILRISALHPSGGVRSSPISAVILTNADVDAVAGLLTLRERHPFALHATAEIHAILDSNAIFEVLARDVVSRPVAALEAPISLGPAFEATLFAVPGKIPLYLEAPDAPLAATNAGVELSDGRHRVLYIPGCAAMTAALARRLAGADLVFFDATLWRDTEMIEAGLGAKTGGRMGHMSLSGPNGTLAAFAVIPVGRKILIHINNSNPVLLADSPERAEAEAAGWTVAEDGMAFSL